MKDRMPYVTDGPDGPMWVTKGGANFGLKNGVGPSGAKLVPGQNRRVDIMAETGLFADGAKDIRRVSDPHLRAKDMDRDGVDAEVIFGILGSASKLQDSAAAAEMFRIYNDWLKDFCSHYPDRHIGLACLPYGDVDWAVQEIHRCAKMGLKGLELSCSWDMEPMWHPCWEPLWKAVDEVQLPLHFHTFPTTPPRAREMTSGQVRRAAMFTGVSAFQMGLIHILAAMMGAGVFERYPNLRVEIEPYSSGWDQEPREDVDVLAPGVAAIRGAGGDATRSASWRASGRAPAATRADTPSPRSAAASVESTRRTATSQRSCASYCRRAASATSHRARPVSDSGWRATSAVSVCTASP